jgi:hypothetical protein
MNSTSDRYGCVVEDVSSARTQEGPPEGMSKVLHVSQGPARPKHPRASINGIDAVPPEWPYMNCFVPMRRMGMDQDQTNQLSRYLSPADARLSHPAEPIQPRQDLVGACQRRAGLISACRGHSRLAALTLHTASLCASEECHFTPDTGFVCVFGMYLFSRYFR